jgi:hypothetical protein
MNGNDTSPRTVAECCRACELRSEIPCYIYGHAGELIAS